MTTLKQGDLIKDSEGSICRVLGVCGEVVHTSYAEDETNLGWSGTEVDLKNEGYTWDTPAWEPKLEEKYWFINNDGYAYEATWSDDDVDNARKNFQGIHQTKELAEAALLEIRRKLGK